MENEYIPTEEELNQAFDLAQRKPDQINTVTTLPEINADHLRELILSGYINPLKFYKWQKQIVDALEALRKDDQIKDAAIDEIKKYPKGKATVDGSVITSTQRATYHYDTCGDSEWFEFQKEKKAIEEKIKEKEALLKALPVNGMVHPDTGEMILPPMVEVKEIITVKP